MSANQAHRRQMGLLVHLARLAEFRTDADIALARLSPDLNLFSAGGNLLVVAPGLTGATQLLAYDLNELLLDGLLETLFLRQADCDTLGRVRSAECGVGLTRKGMAVVRDCERSWLSKAIDKQPMTFLQVVGLLVNAIFAVVNVLLYLRR